MNNIDWPGLIASKLAPTEDLRRTQDQHPQQNQCGSELARDGGGSGNNNIDWPGLIASKLAPTEDCGVHKTNIHNRTNVGASLLAMAASTTPQIPRPGQ
ncbi:hypothetical protein [Pseudomonas ogarae]|uniref:hypothetical protein n=1 Tax=Pseudomonas ogarae (strain DSM 112162 / CECT 30235 / F113) TaxID=1114970 RepID=UPI0013791896|nr:hypothetical protein [Pseudomonas ogarae]